MQIDRNTVSDGQPGCKEEVLSRMGGLEDPKRQGVGFQQSQENGNEL